MYAPPGVQRMTELCHDGEHDNTDGLSIPMYNSSWEKAILVELSECQRLNEFGHPDLVHHDQSGIYSSLVFGLTGAK